VKAEAGVTVAVVAEQQAEAVTTVAGAVLMMATD
jgi:hypothetical protein